MNTLEAFVKGSASRGDPVMVFDWDEAARIIKDAGATEASAGLSDDWEWTGGSILTNGEPDEKSYTYIASTWATPELEIDGDIRPCFRMRKGDDDWDASTKWPESALKILRT